MLDSGRPRCQLARSALSPTIHDLTFHHEFLDHLAQLLHVWLGQVLAVFGGLEPFVGAGVALQLGRPWLRDLTVHHLHRKNRMKGVWISDRIKGIIEDRIRDWRRGERERRVSSAGRGYLEEDYSGFPAGRKRPSGHVWLACPTVDLLSLLLLLLLPLVVPPSLP